MFVDEIYLTIKAGNGGNGLVHFFSDAFRPKGGPDGGDGGDGGSVYFRAVNDITRLSSFQRNKKLEAKSGQPGGQNNRTGAKGEDLIIEIPVGTVVHYDNGTQVELTQVGQTVMAARGGQGGRGNHYFRSATNQTPQESQPGFKTEAKRLRLELKLIAQVGLVGLPNAGKSSLLNELTQARSKVASYPFTTLEPHLGVLPGGYIIADIPGLIEGASQGRGLGYKFLRHLERTSLLVHCVSAESADPLQDIKTINHELSSYSATLAAKPQILLVTKSDLLPPLQLKKLTASLKADLAVSIIDLSSLNLLTSLLSRRLGAKAS